MTDKVARGAGITLSLIFLVSSVAKFVSLRSFAMETKLYIEVYFNGFMRDFAHPVAIGVCLLELLMACLGLWGKAMKKVCLMYVFVLAFFSLITGWNLFFPSPVGRLESCACFGEFIRFDAIGSFIKSIFLWMLSLWLCFYHYHNKK